MTTLQEFTSTLSSLSSLSEQEKFKSIIDSLFLLLEQNIELKEVQQLDFSNILSAEEQQLLNKFFTLVKIRQEQTKLKIQGKFIGFFGPLGVGKTTTASALTQDLGAQFIITEPYVSNPFWKYSQENPEYMLRSQLYFLFTNILSDIEATTKDGTSISDTSTLTDIVMWAHWYYDIGHISEDEYRIYLNIVSYLKPIIPRPTLLVTLLPDSVEALYDGIHERQKTEEGRKGELVFTKEDLAVQIEKVKTATSQINNEWETKTLMLTLNPLYNYNNPEEQQRIVEEIKSHLT